MKKLLILIAVVTFSFSANYAQVVKTVAKHKVKKEVKGAKKEERIKQQAFLSLEELIKMKQTKILT